MQSHDELQEQYIDALIALMMEDVAQIEGQEAQDELTELSRDPDFIIPSDFDQACRKTIHNFYVAGRYRAIKRISLRIIGRIAIIAMTVILLLTTAIAVSPSVRQTVLNYVFRVFEDHTEVSFSVGSNLQKYLVDGLDVPWLPDGYVLREQYVDSVTAWTIYDGPDNRELWITYSVSLNQGSVLNSEDGILQEVSINGWSGYIIEQPGWKSLFLVNTESTASIEVYIYADTTMDLLDNSELIKIAEEMLV